MKPLVNKLLSLLGFGGLGVALPIVGAAQVGEPIADTLLKMLAGIMMIPTTVSTLPRSWIVPAGHIIGRIISNLGVRIKGSQWETTETMIQKDWIPSSVLLIQAISEGMDHDDSNPTGLAR